VTWRHGSRRTKNNPTAAMRSHFLRLRIRPANRDITRNDDGTLPECRLIAEWPTAADEPVKYRLSNMSTRTSLRTVIRHAKLRWRVEHHYRELKTGVGQDSWQPTGISATMSPSLPAGGAATTPPGVGSATRYARRSRDCPTRRCRRAGIPTRAWSTPAAMHAAVRAPERSRLRAWPTLRYSRMRNDYVVSA
jgi:hypothetical protein